MLLTYFEFLIDFSIKADLHRFMQVFVVKPTVCPYRSSRLSLLKNKRMNLSRKFDQEVWRKSKSSIYKGQR